MSKIIVYGSDKCPDCPPALKKLDENNKEYVFINITDSISNLREFLNLRDNSKEFIKIKENGGVGIPCFCYNGKITFDLDEIIK